MRCLGTVIVTVVSLVLGGCPAPNQPPDVRYNDPQRVIAGSSVKLDGTQSFDPEGAALTYRWEQIAGPSVMLLEPESAQASFVAPAGGGTFRFRLTVSDGAFESSTEVVIEVPAPFIPPANLAPVANAGPDQTATPGDRIVLDAGGSSDPEGEPLAFSWRQLSGPAAALANALASNTEFTPANEGDCEFELSVTDTAGGVATDRVLVQVRVASPPALVSSVFDTADDEGWRVEGGDFRERTAPVWSADAGSPLGSLMAIGRRNWYWIAPGKFVDAISARSYGLSLKFDLNQEGYGCWPDQAQGLVVLTGGGHSVYFNGCHGVYEFWTSFVVPFDETAGWFHVAGGAPVTQAEMLAVLGDAQQLKIRGWFLGCDIEGGGGLDNVFLHESALPAATVDRIESRFDVDSDGWIVSNGGFDRAGITSLDPQGNPDQCLTATGFQNWYWTAPVKFRGNRSAAYGGVLHFDLQRSVDGCVPHDAPRLIYLFGGGHELRYSASYSPAKTWTSYDVRLIETEQWFDGCTGNRASQTQMREVLADLRQIHICGWYNACDITGTGGLDNVVLYLGGKPAPLAGSFVQSDFSAGSDGWTVAGGDFGRAGIVSWLPQGGVSGGAASAYESGSWYWMAPAKFRGDASGAYGRALRFNLMRSVDGCVPGDADGLVVLEGGGYQIYYSGTYSPARTWTAYTVNLVETELWYHGGTTRRVTATEFRAVLAHLGQLKIRGWFNACDIDGVGGLDNVVLEVGP